MAIDREKIAKQAKEIIDKFAIALEKVEKEAGDEESFVDRDYFERKEGNGNLCEEDFKKRILENSPSHDNDFIIAEKGAWK